MVTDPLPPVGIKDPDAGSGSNPTILYKKGDTVKPPVVTTSPIGITTTTVYDANGNSRSTLTDPTGKIISTTTMILNPNGGSKTTTADAKGKILSTTVNTRDSKGGYNSVVTDNKGKVSSSTLYDSTGKILSQSSKISTSKTGTSETYSSGKDKSKIQVLQGDGSQKLKNKGMTEVFHQEQNLDKKNWSSTSGASGSPAPNQPQGRRK